MFLEKVEPDHPRSFMREQNFLVTMAACYFCVGGGYIKELELWGHTYVMLAAIVLACLCVRSPKICLFEVLPQ